MRLAPKKNTMAALDAVKADLLHSEDEIAQLMRERQSAIADGNDDRAIACEEREAKVRRRRELLRDRIALLQETLGQEIIDRRQQGHARAVSGVTKRIAALSVFDAELANAITVVANTLEAKSIAMKMLLQEWPQACERPLVSQIGLTNASDSIAAAFSVFDRNKYGRFPDWTFERRLDHVRSTAANFKADEARNYADMLDDLRNSGPKPAESEAA